MIHELSASGMLDESREFVSHDRMKERIKTRRMVGERDGLREKFEIHRERKSEGEVNLCRELALVASGRGVNAGQMNGNWPKINHSGNSVKQFPGKNAYE